jgi:hypothetical protein
MTANGKTVNWERLPENGVNPETQQWFNKGSGKALAEDYQAAIELALERGDMIRAMETSFGSAGIKQRHEGLLRRENADDRRRIDASKNNHDWKIMSGEHLNELGQLAAAGLESVMDVGEYLEKRNAVRPPSQRPLGNALNKAVIQILSGELIEEVKLNAELGNQEILKATRPGQRQQ